MRLYLDNCCLQRPLDDQTQPRIRVETEALFAILATVQAGEHVLLGSEALEYEISRIPDQTRREETMSILGIAIERLLLTDEIEALALSFEECGLRAMDALHLAFASSAKADYFCTSDDKLLHKARTLALSPCNVSTLLNLVQEITK